MKRTSAIPATAVLALLTLTGCGSTAGPGAYMSASGTSVVFIEWQQSSPPQVQGTIYQDQVTGTAPAETLSVNSAAFTGTDNGGTVSLDLGGFLGSQASTAGKVSGNTLTVQVPQNDGTIEQETFTAASVDGFNSAVATLRQKIHAANALAAQAAAAAKTRVAAAASKQASANTSADAVAQAACRQFAGQWTPPGTASYTAGGYTMTIPGGPQQAYCANVPYLGSDDATYRVTINFSATGAAQAVSGWTGTATKSQCSRGYYPDASAGPASAQPGNWSSVLRLCLTTA